MGFMNKFLKWLVFFIIASPWFLIILHNRQLGINYEIKKPEYQFILDDVNTYRGEAGQQLSLPAKLIVNRYTHVTKYAFYNYLKTFDPHFLFFDSPDGAFETPFSGPMFSSILLFIICGFFECMKRNRKLLVVLLFTPIPAIFLTNPYDILPRIPLLITLSAVAAFGVTTFQKKHKWLYLTAMLLLLFELSRFTHNLVVHYPEILATQIYKS